MEKSEHKPLLLGSLATQLSMAISRQRRRSRRRGNGTQCQAKIQTPYGLRTCFEAVVPRQGREPLVARFGGIPLRRDIRFNFCRVIDLSAHPRFIAEAAVPHNADIFRSLTARRELE